MARWRYPSLSVHGIEGAFYEPGAKTVIPAKVIGKFSMRLVPNQDPEHIVECVEKHINQKWAERGSPNKMKVNNWQFFLTIFINYSIFYDFKVFLS